MATHVHSARGCGVQHRARAGLLGVLPGITGTYMANEAIKIILGLENVLSGRVLMFNIQSNNFYHINVSPDPKNKELKSLLKTYRNK